MLGFWGPAGIVGFFPLPGDKRHRMMVSDETENPTLAFFQEAAEARALPGTKVSDPRWMVSLCQLPHGESVPSGPCVCRRRRRA